MLRGLVVRQAFVAADWILVLLVVAGAGVMFFGVVGAAWRDVNVIPIEASALPETNGGVLAQVKPRAEYDGIVGSGLFGSAAQTVTEAPAPPPAPEKEKETELKLKLCGTSATSPRDVLASAVILNQDNNTVRTFAVGQEVVEKVTLEEVYPRKVILFNKGANRREVLRTEEDKASVPVTADGGNKPGTAPSAPASQHAASDPAGAQASNRINVKKTELFQEVFMNYADLATQLKPELARDASGKVTGITASNLDSLSIAKKLDLRNGDVLQTINNEMIDSEDKVRELVNKYRNSNSFRIGILRDGRPQVVTYNLE